MPGSAADAITDLLSIASGLVDGGETVGHWWNSQEFPHCLAAMVETPGPAP